MHIIDWIIEKQSNRHKVRQAKFRNKLKKGTDDLVKFCLQCQHTWEIVRIGNNVKSLYRYESVPSLGKTRKSCPRCKENEINHTN